jgi:hypothetical protein
MKLKSNSLSYILLATLCIYLLGYVVILKRQINIQLQSEQIVLDRNLENENKYKTLVEHTDLTYKSMSLAKKISLKSIINPLSKGLPTLILRVHSNDCNECVKYSLKMLSKLQINKKINLILLADYKTHDSVIKDFGQVNIPIILQGEIPLDLEKVTKPFFLFIAGMK